jgi:hypothetical protein
MLELDEELIVGEVSCVEFDSERDTAPSDALFRQRLCMSDLGQCQTGDNDGESDCFDGVLDHQTSYCHCLCFLPLDHERRPKRNESDEVQLGRVEDGSRSSWEADRGESQESNDET